MFTICLLPATVTTENVLYLWDVSPWKNNFPADNFTHSLIPWLMFLLIFQWTLRHTRKVETGQVSCFPMLWVLYITEQNDTLQNCIECLQSELMKVTQTCVGQFSLGPAEKMKAWPVISGRVKNISLFHHNWVLQLLEMRYVSGSQSCGEFAVFISVHIFYF